MATWVGLDVGGANLKIASQSMSKIWPFPLWKAPEKLASELSDKLKRFEPFENIAVTMTGELADCFESRQAGVEFICEAVEKISKGRPLRFYQTNGNFVSVQQAIKSWRLTAASNWHASAALIGRTLKDCIVVDIGSTTTDIIPIRNGVPVSIGKTDFERLANGELLYTGVSRTSIATVLRTATLKRQRVNLAAEYFASMHDAYIVLGKMPEAPDDRNTADGRPADRNSAVRRLAKLLCLDESELDQDELRDFAMQIYRRHMELIAEEIEVVSSRTGSLPFVVLGEGEWLGREAIGSIQPKSQILNRTQTSAIFSGDLNLAVGPAYAVCELASSLAVSKIH